MLMNITQTCYLLVAASYPLVWGDLPNVLLQSSLVFGHYNNDKVLNNKLLNTSVPVLLDIDIFASVNWIPQIGNAFFKEMVVPVL